MIEPLVFPEMFQLAKFGILPKKFLALQDSQPLCVSCLFGKALRKGWIIEEDGRRDIQRDDDNKPGAGTSIDQLVSDQVGLVPQTSGILTGGCIWGITSWSITSVTSFIYTLCPPL